MPGDALTCPHCSESITADDLFCPHCGKKVEAAGVPKPKRKAPMKTMVSFASATDSSTAPAAVAPVAAGSADPAPTDSAPGGVLGKAPPLKKKPQMKTMMGMSASDLKGLDEAVKDATAKVEAAASTASAKSESGPDPEGKPPAATMLGMSASDLGDMPLPSTRKRRAAGGDPLASTLTSSVPPPADGAPEPEPIPKAAPVPGGPAGRTMIGGPSPAMGLPEPAAKPAAGMGPGGGRTMIGGPAAVVPQAPAASQSDAASQPAQTAEPPVAARGGSRVGMIVVGLGVIVAAAAAFMLSGPQMQVAASVLAIDTGEAILFEVPDAPPGAKLRFGEQIKLLKGGRATFPLASGALKLGDNVVIAEVIEKDGTRTKVKLTLPIEYRIHIDTGPLEAGKGSIDAVVSALPGTKVQLDGQDLKLDAEGRGVQSYPLDMTDHPGGVFEHRVKFRIQPPSGETVVGERITRIMVSRLEIDSPGPTLVTDSDSVQIAGGVDEGSVVSIDGEVVPVNAGRFLQSYPLPKAGLFRPKVRAQLPGRAPRTVELNIKRVDDLVVAAEDFQPNGDIDYTKASKSAATYKGQKAEFEGRVINVMVQGQKSVLQMLVRKCPAGWNCSLWVNFPAGIKVKIDDWVRVLGTLDGQQQFRSESDQIVSVPRLNAAFVLPSKP